MHKQLHQLSVSHFQEISNLQTFHPGLSTKIHVLMYDDLAMQAVSEGHKGLLVKVSHANGSYASSRRQVQKIAGRSSLSLPRPMSNKIEQCISIL